MSKRGQVTVFIILGIVIIAAVALFLYLGDFFAKTDVEEEDAEAFVASQIEPSKKAVKDCVKESLIDAIIFVSKGGGYFDAPMGEDFCEEYSSDYEECLSPYIVSYSFHLGQNRVVTRDKIATELNDYMIDADNFAELVGCVENQLDLVESSGVDISKRDFSLSVPDVGENEIYQSVDFDNSLTVSRGDYSATVNEVVLSVEAPIGKVQEIATDIVGCYIGDYIPSDYNSYCNQDNIVFNAGWYNVDVLQDPGMNIGNFNDCVGECVDCYYIGFDVEDNDAQFNIILKEC
tara:strand:- start:1016 stop:1885 length:870 start_codon:yes stop_codon:yes gene_type:complete